MTNFSMVLQVLGVGAGFLAVIVTIMHQSRKSRDEFTRAIHNVDKRVGIIDSHTSGNADRFNKLENKIEAQQKITSSHEGRIEFIAAQVEKSERRLDALQNQGR